MAFSKDLKVFGRLRRKLCMLLRASIAVPAHREPRLRLWTTTCNIQTTYNIHASACTQVMLTQTPTTTYYKIHAYNIPLHVTYDSIMVLMLTCWGTLQHLTMHNNVLHMTTYSGLLPQQPLHFKYPTPQYLPPRRWHTGPAATGCDWLRPRGRR